MVSMQLRRAPATLAMIGFRQIGQLEINRKCLCDFVGILDGKAGNDRARLGQIVVIPLLFRLGGLAILDEKAPEMLDHVQQSIASLLYEHATQQNSERTNIASEWNFLGGIRGLSGQFEQTIVLISRRPQWRLIHN
jgi:hypothetical protein